MSAALTLTGQLAQDARSMRTRDGKYLLQVAVELPAGPAGKPITVRATRVYGTGPAADIACKRAAWRLRRGVRVTLAGQAIAWQRGSAVLHGLDQLHEPDLPPAFHEVDR